MNFTRNYVLCFCIACILFWSCEEEGLISPMPRNSQPIKSLEDIPHRMLVRGEDQLDIRLEEGFLSNAQVYLTDGSDTTELAEFTPQLPNKFYLTANANYDFPEEPVDLLIQFKREDNDTLFQVPILGYQHIFVNDLQQLKLVNFDNYIYEYELSPDGKTFFYSINPSDGFSSTRLYRYNLETQENELLEEDFKGREIRALSSDEFYYVSKYNGERYLALDTALLIRRNLLNGEDKIIAEVSNDYGRFSRVIEDRMLVVRPWLSEPNCYLVNTTNDELQGVTFNYPMLLEPRLDHIWLGNYKVLPDATLQSFEIAESQDFAITAYDKGEAQVQGFLYNFDNNELPSLSKLRVYESGSILFEESEMKRKSTSTITGKNPAEKPIVIYQKFFDGQNGARDGFYLFDENKPNGKFILSEPESSNVNFWVVNNKFISVRPDGLYLHTLPNGI